MKVIEEAIIHNNTGKSFVVKKGQRIRISAESIVDYISFNEDDLKERFDQATTKGYNGKVYISTGNKVYSNYHNIMMRIVKDTYKGNHDLQYPMCSKLFYDKHYELFKAGDPAIIETFGDMFTITNREDLPDHGCWENIRDALQDYGIDPEYIPNPFDLFQNSKIVGPSGKLVAATEETRPEPGQPVHIDMIAEMNCLVALSACPEFNIESCSEKVVNVQVFDE